MSPKAENFMRALDTLCREHGVTIATSEYDRMDIWDFDGSSIYGGVERVRDRTEPATIAHEPLYTLSNKM